ncbi:MULTISPECIES: GntR family transcriptional regulator [unclassified Rhizobium]|uniref:GntR family transcriptional regulator n=1 Tax=unclassified Rhizobium TaxID=2613769 RepID=UPI000713C4B4|nr:MULTISPECIES: GntR family transcriptional regulator [unclassified Rhizobium]KQS83520.1 GntR family transcriptional regulator [Rhizobium sp. Leaf386]KQT03763.1 GntR family transcriptional regulator [Rhizobium sp. Leaf391]KQU03613.1 GntR family transcriptional regulator [Rhizobium sp. Leaf453]
MNDMTDAGQPFGETVYQSLRADIIMGRLKPGQKLKLDGLRDGYNAGTSTLREALSRLAADGFVRAEGQRGFEVAPISEAGLREIAALRLLLEEHALARSFEAGTLDWEAGVIAAHHKLDSHEERLEAGDTSDINAWRRSDWSFHQMLISACGSRVLMQTHADVFDKYLRYQMIALAFRPSASRPEHRALKEAALSRDIETAIRLLRHHINAGVEHALSVGTLNNRAR